MIPAHFASAVANHLWQSTLIAGAAALLALALRQNRAQTRYWLWLIASVKFLLPFSLLVAMGSHFGSSTAPAAARFGLSFVEEIGQPFAAQAAPSPGSLAAVPDASNPLPVLLLALWACGFVAVSLAWWAKWRRIRASVRAGSPVDLAARVKVLSSPAMLEPGVFGIFRPVLLLPQGIIDRLAPEQLETILAHELCHVRRRDNLTAALHMLVEAIFWFHPLVWWLGARLVEERERACDEEVLRLGSQPGVYAESILKTCQFYLESPLFCVAGVTGSDLKKRIERIMMQRIGQRLDIARKLLLAAAGMAAVAGPLVFGLLNAPPGRAQSPAATRTSPHSFEVATIKQNRDGGPFYFGFEPGVRFVAKNVTLGFVLEFAYGVRDFQVSGGPGWVGSVHYNIEAKPEDSFADAEQELGSEERNAQRLSMVQSLLADRFKLKLHHETKELPVYALVVAKGGPKLHETADKTSDAAPAGPPGPSGRPQPRHSIRMRGRGQLTVNGYGPDRLADVFSRLLGRVVLDQTGLKGKYDFTLNWTPGEGQGQMAKGAGDAAVDKPAGEAAPPPDSAHPSIFTALQEQLGLKLESQKGPVDTLVIDRVEKPSEN